MKTSAALLRWFAGLLGVCSAVHGAAFTFATIDVPFAGAGRTLASGINNSGQIVGSFGPGTLGQITEAHGFLYSGGTFSQLDVPLPGVTVTVALGINNAGQIVGVYSGGHGFLDSGGVFTPIDAPFLFATSTSAVAINNKQQIVGTWVQTSFTHGFLDDGGAISSLDYPVAGNETFPTGINDSGGIVGNYDTYHLGNGGAFVASGGVFVNFVAPFPGLVSLSGINNAGDIVGTVGVNSFLYTRGTFSLIDVPFASASFTLANGINDLGQIVGTYFADGREHGFLAMPVPEPAPFLLLTFGLTLMTAGGRLYAACRQRQGSRSPRDPYCFRGRDRTNPAGRH
jgi:uncharacterized membrane protein